MKTKLTKTESKYLSLFDRRDIRIRIPFQEKRPHILNWTVYYSEPLTIQQLLEKGFNYGIRTGRPIGHYFNVVIDLDDIWAKERIKDTRYVETNKGLHFYLLIKELPKSCWLVNQEADKKLGEIHSRGRQVVGIGSIHEKGTRYTLKGRANVKFCLKFATLRELQEFLTTRNIKTTPWGKTGKENIRDLEPYENKPLAPKIKPKPSPIQEYYQKKEKLEKRINSNPRQENLNICYICLVYFPKELDIIKSHLSGKKHQKNWKLYQIRQAKNFPQNVLLSGNKG